MKILFITENYYPCLSGVPMVVRYLAEGLTTAKGWNVTVATSIPKSSVFPEDDSLNGVRIKRFKIWRNVAKLLRGDLQGIRQFVLNGGFDTIIIECGQAITTDAILPVLKDIKASRILHAHGLSGLLAKPFTIKSDFKHTIGATYNWIRMQRYYGHTFKKACRYIDATISLTDCDSGYDYLNKNIKKNYVLGNAADDLFFESEATPYELNTDGKPYLISIANYSVVKNQIDLLREFYRSEHSKDYALIMIGSSKTEYYHRLIKENERLSATYGKRTVQIMAGIARLCFPYILDRASLYLVSSTHEEFSISIIEAMARGVPFVSTDVGNSRQLPGGVTVVKVRDMHAAIDELLGNEILRKELSAAAHNYSHANCRISMAVDMLEQIVNEVATKQVENYE